MAALGAVKRIEERMGQRRRPLKRLLWNKDQPPLLVGLAIGLGIAALVVSTIALADSDSPTEVGVQLVIGIWAAALLTIALSVIMTARRQAIVIPRPQKDAPPF